MEFEDPKELIVGLVARCTGALVVIVIMLMGGGRVVVGGRVFIGGRVAVAWVTKCSAGFIGFSALILNKKFKNIYT